MENLNAVRERQASTDEMFEPLKQTIELLKENGQELPEEVHDQLQVKRKESISTPSYETLPQPHIQPGHPPNGELARRSQTPCDRHCYILYWAD